MRKIAIDGKWVNLHEHDWEELLKRFDVRRATPSLLREYEQIDVECPLCLKYLGRDCSGCTLHKFEEVAYRKGCFVLLARILGEATYRELNFGMSVISWNRRERRHVKKGFAKVRKLLRSMKTMREV